MTAMAVSSSSSATTSLACALCKKPAHWADLDARIQKVAGTCSHPFCTPCFVTLKTRSIVQCPFDGKFIQPEIEIQRQQISVDQELFRLMDFMKGKLEPRDLDVVVRNTILSRILNDVQFGFRDNDIATFLLLATRKDVGEGHRISINHHLLTYIERSGDACIEEVKNLKMTILGEIISNPESSDEDKKRALLLYHQAAQANHPDRLLIEPSASAVREAALRSQDPSQ